jgi:hypothetical protein
MAGTADAVIAAKIAPARIRCEEMQFIPPSRRRAMLGEIAPQR